MSIYCWWPIYNFWECKCSVKKSMTQMTEIYNSWLDVSITFLYNSYLYLIKATILFRFIYLYIYLLFNCVVIFWQWGVRRQKITKKIVWFGFFVKWQIKLPGLFNAEANFIEERYWYYLTHSCEDKGVHSFPKAICLKVNIFVTKSLFERLEPMFIIQPICISLYIYTHTHTHTWNNEILLI